MKKNWKIMTSFIMVTLFAFATGCQDELSKTQQKSIEEFIENKAELYAKKDEIHHLFDSLDYNQMMLENSLEENLNEVLKDVKLCLTEEEYNRLLANRYLVGDKLLKNSYDEAKVNDFKFEKVAEDIERSLYVKYKVNYTEKMFFEDTLKEENKRESIFTLKNSNGKWLISNIEEILEIESK